MTEPEFWQVVEEACQYTGNIPFQHTDLKASHLIDTLSNFNKEDIIDFERILQIKVIEARQHYNVSALYEIIDGPGISDDCYLYFLYALIAQGQKIVDTALYHPDTLAPVLEPTSDIDAECFMYIADEAFEKRFGTSAPEEEYPRNQVEDMELPVSSKRIGQQWEYDDLPVRFPTLWQKFKRD
ncbi:DUF4240 domain-containing protein [Xanthocytophaga flava]|uniref:DUF4240 domain-containing protein n=1 Tax=Xanthocytophaga flava TaxID=3048013 RepID=UPI0028D45C3D|nr:DUF4240 domain-containing protein [Xanthocytophaga flavus]MDJ1466751.1 DUF4240 domain-containing protein [Xanthocytophaga flavus]